MGHVLIGKEGVRPHQIFCMPKQFWAGSHITTPVPSRAQMVNAQRNVPAVPELDRSSPCFTVPMNRYGAIIGMAETLWKITPLKGFALGRNPSLVPMRKYRLKKKS